MYAGSKFQVVGAETEDDHKVKLLLMPDNMARTFALAEHGVLDSIAPNTSLHDTQ